MSESIIRFVDVTKAYDDEAILERFSLDIGRGEFLTIIGSSTKRGSVELFFYKNEFALVYRLGDA